MKICFMCDLHLSVFDKTPQNHVLDWAIEDISHQKPDCIIYAGDVTCDGEIDTYYTFLDRMNHIGIPFIYIPGNSDLRNKKYAPKIAKITSPCENIICGVRIFAVNDCDRTVSDETLKIINTSDSESIVFMHHPISVLKDESRIKMTQWRETHNDTMLFYGHRHIRAIDGNDISLPAMDPDKSIGESAAITYYDTVTKELFKSNFPINIPFDLTEYLGVSCYKIEEHIKFATENKLKNLELRPNCLNIEKEKLISLVNKWRAGGGENLCMHFPDVAFLENTVILNENFNQYIELARILKIDRITQHVPKVSVKTVRVGEKSLEQIAQSLASGFNLLEHDIVIGVENMHMTNNDTPDENRRFGYLPEECIEFMQVLDKKCKHKVGINFDIGHARNNAPYSQKYQIGTWLSLIGKHIVGYHLHQVTNNNGVFENHTAITDVFGKLISFGSFFDCWVNGICNKVPVILEMRTDNAYETTLAVFNSANKS